MNTITNGLQTILSRRSHEHVPMAREPVCEVCGGKGYLRYDVMPGHELFGHGRPCECVESELHARTIRRLMAESGMEPLLARMRFENFVTIESQKRQRSSSSYAYVASQQWAENPRGFFVLIGDNGTGKTHLAAAIANTLLERGTPVLIENVPELLRQLKATFNRGSHETFEDRFERFQNVDVLVLDDLGAEAHHRTDVDWAQEQLYMLVDHRYRNTLATVVTSNLEPQDMPPRIRTRIISRDGGNVVTIRGV